MIIINYLQPLYGAHDARMVNPFFFLLRHLLLLNLRGSLNILPSRLRLHFDDRLLVLQQLIIIL